MKIVSFFLNVASACPHTESCSEGVRMLVFFSKVLPQEPGPGEPAMGRMPRGPAGQPAERKGCQELAWAAQQPSKGHV